MVILSKNLGKREINYERFAVTMMSHEMQCINYTVIHVLKY